MSAEIKSGATTDLLTVDSTSKAARVTLYKSDGSEVFKEPIGAYFLAVPHLAQSVALAVGSSIWAMRNGSARNIIIKSILLRTGFSGTAAATSSCYQLCRFTGANLGGGTTLTSVQKSTLYPASTIQDARYSYAAALTVVGVTFETSFVEVGCQRQLNTWGLITLRSGPDRQESLFELQPNEGIAIKLGIVGTIGDNIGGSIEWEEV